MSQENVEVVRRAWETYNDRGTDAALDYYAEDCVCEDVPDLPDPATYRGREGARERERHFKEMWEDWAWEPVEFIDAGDDIVVAMVVMRAHGRGSGAPIEVPAAFVYEGGVPVELETTHVWTVRKGRATSLHAFRDRSQALEAARLRE